MVDTPRPADLPEGIFSLLDTDLYKLTMQCCVLKYFPDVQVTYNYTNRTPDMKFSRTAVGWLKEQVNSTFGGSSSALKEVLTHCAELENISLTKDEYEYLETTCPFLSKHYLDYLSTFRLKPRNHIELTFSPTKDTNSESDTGDIYVTTKGSWLDTILYEIPLLALISETYFKFMDRDWSYMHQVERARDKGTQLLRNGCVFSEFGSRRRRDYHTQDLVLQGLRQAANDGEHEGWTGKLAGTSNVHFAMKHGIPPVGTVAHEWFMAVAAITNDYEHANEIALRYWVGTFGEGVLGIALTDTFGTEDFLKAFAKPCPKFTTAAPAATSSTTDSTSLGDTVPPVEAPAAGDIDEKSYAEVFTGVRQDSGDPETFIKRMRRFYDSQSIAAKTIVFSDSLNVDLCLKYKKLAEEAGFIPGFGVGTFLTNDYRRVSTGTKSIPLNIVIKIASCNSRAAVKISDNIGKNTGDKTVVMEVKQRLGYTEAATWEEGDEKTRWGKEGDR